MKISQKILPLSIVGAIVFSADLEGMLQRQPAAAAQNEAIIEQLNRFADACLLKEGYRLQSIEPMTPMGEGLRKGCQNRGLWHVKARNGEHLRNFIIKSGNFNEFESAQTLHSKLSELNGSVPGCVKFAYPRYMLQIETLDGGILSAGEIYGLEQNAGEGISKSMDSAVIQTLLFMDEACGMPGNCFVRDLSKYSEDQQKAIYRNFAEAANTLLLLGHPDDAQNLDNIMIDPSSGVVTYIDFDRFHFGAKVDRNWYYTLVDAHTGICESARQSFYEALHETLRPFADERLHPERVVRIPRWHTELCPPEFATTPYALVRDFEEFRGLWSTGRYKRVMIRANRIDMLETFATSFATIKEFFRDKNKEALLSEIKGTVIKQVPLIEKQSGNIVVTLPYNELYITEQEMWAIEVSPLPEQQKQLLEKAYILTIGKPWLYAMCDHSEDPSFQKLSAEELAELHDILPLPAEGLAPIADAYCTYARESFVRYTDDPMWNAEIKVK
ncbi:MAG: hypothetical protein LBG20_00870 [Holosporaceae bacterium]|jgi:hypothetical protein|nr:hypothetical protein [Holosporaceae bacterium]